MVHMVMAVMAAMVVSAVTEGMAVLATTITSRIMVVTGTINHGTIMGTAGNRKREIFEEEWDCPAQSSLHTRDID